MAQRENIVEQYLDAIARGEQLSITRLLPLLSEQVLYVPVLTYRNIGDERGTSKIKIASFISGPRRVVPVFTSEDFFLGWSDGSNQCFPVAGGDLALTLPEDAWIVLNPGQVHALELSPDDIRSLAEMNAEVVMPPTLERIDELPESEQDEVPESSVTDDSVIGFSAEDIVSVTSREPPLRIQTPEEEGLLLKELEQILAVVSEVQEGYFQETGPEQAVLGLLTTELETEQRFLLIDQIAEVSRRFYGTAGAIEVYDDLELRSSRSWELFNTITPFYTREAEHGNSLRVEVERVAPGRPPLLRQIRRTGMRFLKSLRSGQ